MSFHCTIVTPESEAFDADVTQVILPAHDGQMGILTNRAPILVELGIGSLQIDMAGSKTVHYYVDGGVAQMKDNKLTLITQSAQASTAIDKAKAQADLTAAEALPATDKTKQAAIKRAQTKLAVAAK